LTADQLHWVPFFCNAFTKMGTHRHDFAEMARRMDLYTGGVGLGASARTRYDAAGTCLPFVILDGKCLSRNIGHMIDILAEYVGEIDFFDMMRIRQLLMEYRAGLESMVIHNGHRLAMSLAARRFSAQTALSELWNGIHQVQFIKRFTDDLSDADIQRLSETLSTIRSALFTAKNVRTVWIGEDSSLRVAGSTVSPLRNRLGFGDDSETGLPVFGPPPIETVGEIPREGWSTASSVSFVAQLFETVRMGHPDAPALSLIAKMLRSLYLHREIREKGGAYGGFAVYSQENGLFGFASYRDPHIVSTLNAFSGAAAFIRSGTFTEEDVKEALLQVCAELDRPDPPGPTAKKAYMRRLVSLSDEDRRAYKANLLSLTRDRVVTVADKYFAPDRPGRAVAVISGEDKLTAANARLGEAPLLLNRI
jgi:Zn-dependent M16 (insulinase) family peptidase